MQIESTLTKQLADCTICPPIAGIGGIADVDLFACFDVADDDGPKNFGRSWSVDKINVDYDRSMTSVVDNSDKKTYGARVAAALAAGVELAIEDHD